MGSRVDGFSEGWVREELRENDFERMSLGKRQKDEFVSCCGENRVRTLGLAGNHGVIMTGTVLLCCLYKKLMKLLYDKD